MDCVVCKEPMIVLEIDKVEIDYCLECKGIWLDSDELEMLLDDPEKVKYFLNNPGSIKSVQKSKHKCPVCLKRMEQLEVGNKPKIVIDRCKQGDGIWFDRGELKDIVSQLEGTDKGEISKLLRDTFKE